MPRLASSSRRARNEVTRQRLGYCPVVSATRDGEQIGEFT
jgi:hypothetical protein